MGLVGDQLSPDLALWIILADSGKDHALLCIDEIMKAGKQATDVSHQVGLLISFFPEKRKNFLFPLETTLDIAVINREKTASSRAIDWVRLPGIKTEESATLFDAAFPLWRAAGTAKSWTDVVGLCISDCGGHPRTLEIFKEVLKEFCGDINCWKDSRTAPSYGQISAKMKTKLKVFPAPEFDVICAAVLGEPLNAKDKIGTETVSDLVNGGYLDNSLDDLVEEMQTIVPKLSVFRIRVFCTKKSP